MCGRCFDSHVLSYSLPHMVFEVKPFRLLPLVRVLLGFRINFLQFVVLPAFRVAIHLEARVKRRSTAHLVNRVTPDGLLFSERGACLKKPHRRPDGKVDLTRQISRLDSRVFTDVFLLSLTRLDLIRGHL